LDSLPTLFSVDRYFQKMMAPINKIVESEQSKDMTLSVGGNPVYLDKAEDAVTSGRIKPCLLRNASKCNNPITNTAIGNKILIRSRGLPEDDGSDQQNCRKRTI
jgi:hypothetical protein